MSGESESARTPAASMASSENWSTEASWGSRPTISPPLPDLFPVEPWPAPVPRPPRLPPQTFPSQPHLLDIPYPQDFHILPLPVCVGPSASSQDYQQQYQNLQPPNTYLQGPRYTLPPPSSPRASFTQPPSASGATASPYQTQTQSISYPGTTVPPTYPTTNQPFHREPTNFQPSFTLHPPPPPASAQHSAYHEPSNANPYQQPYQEPDQQPLPQPPQAPYQASYDTHPTPWSPLSTPTDTANRKLYINQVTGPGEGKLDRNYPDKMEKALGKIKKERGGKQEGEEDREEDEDDDSDVDDDRRQGRKRRKGEGMRGMRSKDHDDDKHHDGDKKQHGRSRRRGGRRDGER